MKALILGLIALLVENVIWAVVIGGQRQPHPLLVWACWLSPCFVAFVVSYLSSRNEIISGLMIAIFGAVLSVSSNATYTAFGLATDFPGLEGAKVLFGIVFVSNMLLCIVGCSLGSIARKFHRH